MIRQGFGSRGLSGVIPVRRKYILMISKSAVLNTDNGL